MATVTELKMGGKTIATTTKTVKKGIVIPAKKTMAVAKNMTFVTPAKLSTRMQHIHKMAQKHIVAQKKAAITRRSKAVKILKMKDGRKVFVKKFGSQTKRSLVNPNETPKTRCARASRDHKAMLKVVGQYKLAHLNKIREENVAKKIKAGKKDAKFTPIKIQKGSLHALAKYNDKVEKTNVKVFGLPMDVNYQKIRLALGPSSKNVQDIKIVSGRKIVKSDKKSKTKVDSKVAVLSTPNALAAQNVVASRVGKMHLGTCMVVAKPVVAAAATKEEKAEAKKAKEVLKAKKAVITKKNQESHVANEKAVKRNSQHRRAPKHVPTKVFRNRTTHQIYAVKRSSAGINRPVRGKMSAHNRMRSMVRVSRK